MSVRKLVDDDYSSETIEGKDECVQCLTTKLRMWLGEWFLEVDSGTDYMSILGQKNIISKATEIIKKRIMEVKLVEKINAFVITVDRYDRSFHADFSVVYNGQEFNNISIPLSKLRRINI